MSIQTEKVASLVKIKIKIKIKKVPSSDYNYLKSRIPNNS
jgi:hypothetical protein